MSQTTQCRLCLQYGAGQKQLYDESGELNLEIFNKMKTFFNPKFLNIHMAICLGCWHHISKFYQLLNSFAQNQCNINDNNADNSWQGALMPLKLTNKTFSESPTEAFDQHQHSEKTQQLNGILNEYDTEDSETGTASLTPDIKEEISTEEYMISENFIPALTAATSKNKKLAEAGHKKRNSARPQRGLDKIISKWKSLLECGVCQKSNVDFSFLEQHFSLEHSNVNPHIVCCKTKLSSKKDIADHAAFHMNTAAFKCHKCDKCCQDERQLHQHIRILHGKEKSCTVCHKVFSSAYLLKEHMLYHTREKIYKCPACPLTSAYVQNLRRHLKKTHPELWSEDLKECSFYDSNIVASKYEANKVKVKRTSTNIDEIIAQWKSTLECGICQKSQANHLALRNHFSLEHVNKRAHIVCCQRILRSRKDIADHAKFHMNPESYKCNKCGKCFTGLGPLLSHMEFHAKGDQTYKCLICAQIYNLRSSLDRHLRRKHPQLWAERDNITNFKETSCTVCNNVFSSADLLREHMLCHTRANQVKIQSKSKDFDEVISQWKSNLECGICQKSHRNYLALRKHFNLEHVNKRLHIFCCQRQLRTHLEIADHAKFHMNPESFKCQKCGKCFTDSGKLLSHMEFHTNGDQTYKCLGCARTYNLVSTLDRHLKNSHPKLWSERDNIANFYESMQITVRDTIQDIENIISQWKSSLECGICQKPHKKFSDLTKHFQLEHDKENAYILCCKRKLLSRFCIAEHARWHLDPEVFKCQKCDICFKTRFVLRRHINSKHPSKGSNKATHRKTGGKRT